MQSLGQIKTSIMSNWTEKIQIQPLYRVKKFEKTTLLEPSDNLRMRRDPLDASILENSVHTISTVDDARKYISLMIGEVKFDDYERLDRLIEESQKGEQLFKNEIRNDINDFGRLWYQHVIDLLGALFTKELKFEFEEQLIRVFESLANQILTKDKLREYVDLIALSKSSEGKLSFCNRVFENITFNKDVHIPSYRDPHIEIEKMMMFKDKYRLEPIRKIWPELFSLYWHKKNQFSGNVVPVSDMEIRYRLLKEYYPKYRDQFSKISDAIRAFMEFVSEHETLLGIKLGQIKGLDKYNTLRYDISNLYKKKLLKK